MADLWHSNGSYIYVDPLQPLAAFLQWSEMKIYSIFRATSMVYKFKHCWGKCVKRKLWPCDIEYHRMKVILRSVLKASLLVWSDRIESVGGCLVDPTFIAIDTVTCSHWESVDKSSFLLYKLWCNQVEFNDKMISLKASLFEWSYLFKTLAVVLSTPRLLTLILRRVSHLEPGVRHDLHLLWTCYPIVYSVENP
jgi:hypothetical protein